MIFRATVILICIALSVTEQIEAQRQLVHPDKANLEVPGVAYKIARRDTSSASALLTNWARGLRQARLVDSIGTLDGEIETVIGMIQDAVVTRHGDILVVDRANAAVRAFSADGSFRFSLGREGSGPTDLRNPVGVWETLDGDVAVFDAVLGLKFFTIADSGTARLRDLIRLRVGAFYACSAAGRVFALAPSVGMGEDGANDGSTVRVYDDKGKLLSTFGEAYKSPAPLVRLMMSEGRLGCATDGTVLEALSWLPYLRAYSRDGKLRWTIQFLDFSVGRHLERINERGQRTIGLDPSDPTSSFTLRIRELAPGYAAVQIGLMTPASIRNRTIYERIDTYVIATATGQGVYVSSSLPLLAGMQGTRLIGYRNDPYPQIEILQVPQSARLPK